MILEIFFIGGILEIENDSILYCTALNIIVCR